MSLKSKINQVVRVFSSDAESANQSRRRIRSQPSGVCQFERLENRQLFATLHAGDVVYGWTNSPSQQNTYEIQASAGTQVELVTKAVPGSMAGFLPAARLYAPNGALIRSFSESSGNQAFALPNQTGVYTLRINDDNWSQSGTYAVGLETTRPASPDARALEAGSVIFGWLNNRLQKDQHLFYAKASDVFDLTMAWDQQPAYFAANAELIGPDGRVISQITQANKAHRFTAAQTGWYIVQVHDDDLSQTGVYRLGLETIKPAAPNSPMLPVGGIIWGDLRDSIQRDQFVIDAKAGEIYEVVLRSSATQPGFLAKLEVVSPSGAVRLTGNGNSPSQRLTITETGRYVFMVGDDDLMQRGTYQMGLERIKPASPDAMTIKRGEVRYGDLRSGVQKDQYVFPGIAGQVVDLVIRRESGATGFVPTVFVYGPSGNVLKTFTQASGNIRMTLAETGNFVVQVFDNDWQQTGTYSIGMEGISPWSPDARTLARNTWVYGDLRHSLQKDQFVISGSAGQVIQLRTTRQSSSANFDPLIEVFNQAGTRVTWFRASTGLKSFTLNATGRYMIQIAESGFDATGTYWFRWN